MRDDLSVIVTVQPPLIAAAVRWLAGYRGLGPSGRHASSRSVMPGGLSGASVEERHDEPGMSEPCHAPSRHRVGKRAREGANESAKRRAMKIGELAERVGVNVQTVRYYERRNLLPEPERTESGYREYDEHD